jgi:hypothetical protein
MGLKDTIGNLNVLAPFQAYQKYIGNRPAVEIPVLAGLGGLIGYGGTGFAMRKAAEMVAKGIPPERLGMTRQEFDKELAGILQPSEVNRYRLMGGALGALAGGGAGLLGYGTERGLGANPFQTDKEFFQQNPDRLDHLRRRAQERIQESMYEPGKFTYTRGQGFQKSSSDDALTIQNSMGMPPGFDDPFVSAKLPVSATADLVMEDPFLDMQGKHAVVGLVQDSAGNDETGLTTGRKIMRTALQAGVGFGAAYGTGKALSTLMGMPKPLAAAIQGVGGLAGALVNTGLFKDLRSN